MKNGTNSHHQKIKLQLKRRQKESKTASVSNKRKKKANALQCRFAEQQSKQRLTP
jgi:hypothetical protein